MANAWFETVAEAQRRAKKRLPPSVYGALIAGSEKGVTVSDNVNAFSEIGFAPHVAGLSAKRDLATTVMGQPVSLPVIISPTGVQAVHPDGEVAVARAAAARGTVMGLSSFASKPVEDVVAANPKTFFQTYWAGPREQLLDHIERARAAGAAGLIVTLDWSFSNGRAWGSPVIPERVDLKTMMRFAPEVLRRPRWLLDGGDVVKAVALGARAVMIGRAYLWGLAANGQAGVENVLDILRGGIDSALLGLGHGSIHDLTPDDIVIPPGFIRTLGAGHPAGG